jgi:hypothetical protein
MHAQHLELSIGYKFPHILFFVTNSLSLVHPSSRLGPGQGLGFTGLLGELVSHGTWRSLPRHPPRSDIGGYAHLLLRRYNAELCD